MTTRLMYLTIWVTDEERERMKAAAKAAGCRSVSKWAELNLPQLAEVEGQDGSNQDDAPASRSS